MRQSLILLCYITKVKNRKLKDFQCKVKKKKKAQFIFGNCFHLRNMLVYRLYQIFLIALDSVKI